MKKQFAAVIKEQALFPAFDILFCLECTATIFLSVNFFFMKTKFLYWPLKWLHSRYEVNDLYLSDI